MQNQEIKLKKAYRSLVVSPLTHEKLKELKKLYGKPLGQVIEVLVNAHFKTLNSMKVENHIDEL